MRARLIAGAVALVLVAGGVVVAVRSDDDGGVRVATDASVATTLPEEVADEVTTTTVTVPAVTVPTVPSLRPVTTTTGVKRSTTTTAKTGPTRCGEPNGYAGLGGSKTTTTGSITLTLETYMCEMYDGDFLQSHLIVRDRSSVLRRARLDFGDGKADEGGVHHWTCEDPDRPDPYYRSSPFHTYAQPGTFTLTGTVTTVSCDGSATEQTATVSITVYRHAGKRPGS